MSGQEALVAFDLPAPAELPTSNKVHRGTWHKWARVEREVRALVAMKAKSARHRAGMEPCGKEKRWVVITLVRAGRQGTLDRDNLIAGLKPVVDALGPARELGAGRGIAPGAGLIHDDRDQYVDVDYHQERGPKPVIRIEVWANG